MTNDGFMKDLSGNDKPYTSHQGWLPNFRAALTASVGNLGIARPMHTSQRERLLRPCLCAEGASSLSADSALNLHRHPAARTPLTGMAPTLSALKSRLWYGAGTIFAVSTLVVALGNRQLLRWLQPESCVGVWEDQWLCHQNR